MVSSSSSRAPNLDDRGFATVQLVVASAVSLLLLASFASLLVDLYARAALRAAVDEGARAVVSAAAEPELCEQRARDALDDLVRGRIGDDLHVTCTVDERRALVVGGGTLPGWGLVPDWSVEIETVVVRER